MDQLILDLLQTAREPRTVAELVHELTVLRRIGAVRCDQVTELAVLAHLESLEAAGRVRRYDVEWRHVPEDRQAAASQLALF